MSKVVALKFNTCLVKRALYVLIQDSIYIYLDKCDTVVYIGVSTKQSQRSMPNFCQTGILTVSIDTDFGL